MLNIQHTTKIVALPNEVELTDEQLKEVTGGQDEIEDNIAAWTAALESEGYSAPLYPEIGPTEL